MKRKKYSKHLILACAISSMAMPALAQTDIQTQPAYSSSSEALSAEQQAQQKANRTHTTLDESLTRLNDLEDQKRKVQGSDNSHQIMATETALKNAGDMYMDQLSSMTGVSFDDLEKMHDAGVSYQDMTSELGVQAHAGQMAGSGGGAMGDRQGMKDNLRGSNLDMNSGQHGLSGADSSSMMGSRTDEIMNATARNTESGWSEGHGSGMQTNTGQDRDGGMMAGAGGLSNGMSTSDAGGHDAGMGASGRDNSGSSGVSGSSGGGMGGSSGGGHGGGSGGGSGGGHGGGGGGMM